MIHWKMPVMLAFVALAIIIAALGGGIHWATVL